MKAVFKRDDTVLLSTARLVRIMQSSKLDRTFVRLGSAVRKKDLTETSRDDRLGKISLGLGVPGVRDMNQVIDLLLDRLHHFRRAMSQNIAAPTRKQIKILLALGIPDVAPFPVNQTHGIALVVGNHVLRELINGFLAGTSRGGMHGVSWACFSKGQSRFRSPRSSRSRAKPNEGFSRQ